MSVVTGPDNQREEKISSLVRLYEKDLLRTCCVYLRDRDMAQDAVQETFLKAYKALDSFRSESTEKTWLYYYEDMNMKDIGDMLGVAATTVGYRLDKARTLLRCRLGGGHPDEK